MRSIRSHYCIQIFSSFCLLLAAFATKTSLASDNALTLPESCHELESMMRQGFDCSRDRTPWKIVSAFRTCKGDIEVRDRLVTREQCSAWENAYNEQYEFISQRYTHLQGCLKASDTPTFDPEALTYCKSVVAAEGAEAAERAAPTASSEPVVRGFSGAITRLGRSGLSGGSARLFNLPNQGNDRHSGDDLETGHILTASAVGQNPPTASATTLSDDSAAAREPASMPPAANYSSAKDVRKDINERIRLVKADTNLTQKQKKKRIQKLKEWERKLLSQVKDANGLTDNELENFEDKMNRFDLSLRGSQDQGSVMARHQLLRERIKAYNDRRKMDKKEFKKLMRKLKRVKKKHRQFSSDELTQEEIDILDSMLDEIKKDFQKYRVKNVDMDTRLQRAEAKIEELFAEGHLSEAKKNEALQKLGRLHNQITRASSGNSLGSGMSHDDKLELIRKIGDVVRDVHERRGRVIQREKKKK